MFVVVGMIWVVGLILHGGPMELFLIPASAPRLVKQKPWYMLSCLWDNAYKRTLAANQIEGYYQLLTISPRQTTQFITGMCAHDSHVL